MKRIEVQGFWKWAFSDFMSNSLRGVLAEYIIAGALGCTKKPRTEWDAYDLATENGLKIEVKSSSYLQTWKQKKHSVIRFDIDRKQAWDAQTNTSSLEAIRSADVYVFCVFSTTDKALADPLDLGQWFFLVCPTTFLNKKLANQKSISLAALEQHGFERLTYEQLAEAINAVGESAARMERNARKADS